MYSNYEKMLGRLPTWVLVLAAGAVLLASAYTFDISWTVVIICGVFGLMGLGSRSILPWMREAGVTPNQLTIAGSLLSLAAAVCFAAGWTPAGCLLTIAGAALCDVWDGLLSRMYNLGTRFGSVLDSVLDRLSDGFIFSGVAFRLLADGEFFSGILALYATVTAQVVSYSRARAETQIASCEVSLLGGRPERLALLIYFGLIGHWLPGLMLICLFQSLTIIRRMVFTYRQLKADIRAKERATRCPPEWKPTE
ncbi:MAG: CDP-alcohol phosphatidyltransferase family protein [Deltaproteobacteria bacterium]|nr:CDP-alcohol phosphatidyltransferase family protein [Deltaproteobacteria bacterium]